MPWPRPTAEESRSRRKDHVRSRRKDHMKDERLSAAILSYVGWDTDAALPGRYLDRIADGH